MLGGARAISFAATQLKVWGVKETLTSADLNNNFAALQDGIVPAGAVLAFNLAACPAGWTALSTAAGRTIVGVNPSAGNGISQRNLGDTFGEEQHALSVAEMRAHSHTFGVNTPVGTIATNGTTGLAVQGGATVPSAFGQATTDAIGSGHAFDKTQPSPVLLYCQKN